MKATTHITIDKVNTSFEREKLAHSFGFKGGFLSELWQSVAYMTSSAGKFGLGLSTQSILWSDAQVFAANSESGGNALMFAVSQFALNLARGTTFSNPIDLLKDILPETYQYAKKITNRRDLRLTFALNALVGFDNAAWMLYSQENQLNNYDELIGTDYQKVLSHEHRQMCCIPLISYGVSIDDVHRLAKSGYFILKIKVGSDPDKDGNPDKMLEWDKARIEAVHKAVADVQTPYTDTGKVAYYLDANGRYDSKDRLRRLLDHARKIGAFEQIILLEEPFPEQCHESVGDLGVRVAADESAHSDKDAKARIEMGYGAIALKPIAKTMSMSLKIAKLAKKAGVPCFCADLTVNPILVEWNKCFAARLEALPGVKIGAFETNGDQNYRNWDVMCSYHPFAGRAWTKPHGGLFILDDDFHAKSGGILIPSEHYLSLVK